MSDDYALIEQINRDLKAEIKQLREKVEKQSATISRLVKSLQKIKTIRSRKFWKITDTTGDAENEIDKTIEETLAILNEKETK